jgi:hypothetical protein
MASEQKLWPGDDDGCAALYSYSPLPAGERLPAADSVGDRGGSEHGHAHSVDERVVPAPPPPDSVSISGSPPVWPDETTQYADSWWGINQRGSVRSSRDAWPYGYRRVLSMAFHGAVFALGLFLGTLAPGYIGWSPLAPHLPSNHTTHSPVATQHASTGGTSTRATPDAAFAVAILRVHCIQNPCAETQFVPAGQHVYALQRGISCTTTNAIEVVGQREAYVNCRLDQPDVFTYSFNGAQFNCVGSQLGCHNVVVVDMTNDRSGIAPDTLINAVRGVLI